MKHTDFLSLQRIALALRESRAPGGPGRVVLVTSARRGEGKSLLAGLLARALADQQEGEVLLAEAGLRGEPGALGDGPGLHGLLGGAPLAGLVKPTGERAGLWRLPRGEGYGVADLFRTAALREALQSLRQRFELSVVDGPELEAAGGLLALSDRSVLVVDASRTAGTVVRSATDAALAAARLPREHVVGVVLNRQPSGLPRWLGG